MPRKLSKSSAVWLALTAALVALGVLSLVTPPRSSTVKALTIPAFDLQGHRGARGLFPENSLPGFEGALALGVTTLELDLGMTEDGILLVHHDRRLDVRRTRGPDGAWLVAPVPLLRDITAAEARRYDIGRLNPESDTARRFPEQAGLDGVAIPTLEEVVILAEAQSGGTVRYNMETKITPLAPGETASPEDFAQALVALIKQHGIAERVTVQSFDWRSLNQVRAMDPDLAIVCLTAEQDWLDNVQRGRDGTSPWTAGLDVDRFDGSVPRLVKEAGAVVWSPYFRDLRETQLAEARRLGLKVVPWTVNEPGAMASLLDLGIDGIITDYPDRLRGVMAARGMALPPAFPVP